MGQNVHKSKLTKMVQIAKKDKIANLAELTRRPEMIREAKNDKSAKLAK